MSIIDNVSSITLLPTESLLREMSKVPIFEIKANEKELIVEKNLYITYEHLLSKNWGYTLKTLTFFTVQVHRYHHSLIDLAWH